MSNLQDKRTLKDTFLFQAMKKYSRMVHLVIRDSVFQNHLYFEHNLRFYKYYNQIQMNNIKISFTHN